MKERVEEIIKRVENPYFCGGESAKEAVTIIKELYAENQALKADKKQVIINALNKAPLSISQTRRAGTNGLRNADEIADNIIAALQSKGGDMFIFKDYNDFIANGLESIDKQVLYKRILIKIFGCRFFYYSEIPGSVRCVVGTLYKNKVYFKETKANE